MPSLPEIKARLNSVKTTKKITKAMQLVAASKLRKIKTNLVATQQYYHAVYDTFQKLLNSVEDFKTLIPSSNSKKWMYIIITSDLGLCGSYNSNIFKLVKSKLKEDDELIVVGSKGVMYFRARNIKMQLELDHVGDEPSYEFASKLGQKAIAEYLTGEISGVSVVHTKFINSVTYDPCITQILPIVKSDKQQEHFIAEFEPDPVTVAKNIIPLYCSSVIFGALVESKVSEMSSRRSAMENATDNADELIEQLNLEYNRVRQATITQEISEIVAGSAE